MRRMRMRKSKVWSVVKAGSGTPDFPLVPLARFSISLSIVSNESE